MTSGLVALSRAIERRLKPHDLHTESRRLARNRLTGRE
jgi:hypothetical protein